MPVGAHEGYRKSLTELYAGGRGISTLNADAMARFPTLEVLWLNGNKLTKLKGLERNFRIKHLYLQDNAIATVCNASCCLLQLRHLETLQLANNQLKDLKATLGVLSQLPFLKKLQLAGNPLEAEASYREAIIFHVPTLKQLDSALVTPLERAAAVKLFTAKRIEKPIAFMTVPKIWEKPRKIAIGEISVGELQLRQEVLANTRRRQEAAKMCRVVTNREAQKPSFDLTFSKGASDLLSATFGGPVRGDQAFEFVARGRVPKLLVRLTALTLAPEVTALADSVGGDGATVYLVATCLGLQRQPLRSAEVHPRHLANGATCFVRREDGGGKFEGFLFPDDVYATAYDKVLTYLQTGDPDAICVVVSLKESATGTTLASCRVPLAPLLLAVSAEQEYRFDATPLLPAVISGAGDAALGTLTVNVTTDWGLANTSAGAYGNSRFSFLDQRRSAEGLSGSSGGADASAEAGGVHLMRDRFRVMSAAADTADGSIRGGAPASDAALHRGGGLRLDEAAYAAYEKSKAMKLPTNVTRAVHHL